MTLNIDHLNEIDKVNFHMERITKRIREFREGKPTILGDRAFLRVPQSVWDGDDHRRGLHRGGKRRCLLSELRRRGHSVGGGLLSQAGFAISLLREFKKSGFHTTIDTCGYGEPDALKEVLRHADLVFFDLKHMDGSSHERLTGVLNKPHSEQFCPCGRKRSRCGGSDSSHSGDE